MSFIFNIILVQIDATKIFNNVLIQHTQMTDSNGNPTVTRHYCDLYIEKLLKNIEKVSIVYSPSQKCFISTNKDQQTEQIFYESYINFNG